MDEHGASWALWVYEERSQGQWGLFDAVDENTRGPIRTEVVHHVARPFPAAVTGGAVGWSYDPANQTLVVQLQTGGEVTLAVPAHVWQRGINARCDGVHVDVARGAGRATLTCAGTELRVAPE